GMGLDGLLRQRAAVVSGILNGVDETIWDPATDPYLASTFDAKHLARRAINRGALQALVDLSIPPDGCLFGVVSRLTWQKGMDLLLDALPALIDGGGGLVLLGSGEKSFEHAFLTAAKRHPGRVAAVIEYDEGLAHLIQGGVDALLVPSRFEPCGLT